MSTTDTIKRTKGFAGMDPEKQRAIASKGGRAAHEKGRAHEFTPDQAREAGRKGGRTVSNRREHMAEIGRRGGRAVSANREHMARIGRLGGAAVSSDRRHMAEIGRVGGSASADRDTMEPNVHDDRTLPRVDPEGTSAQSHSQEAASQP